MEYDVMKVDELKKEAVKRGYEEDDIEKLKKQDLVSLLEEDDEKEEGEESDIEVVGKKADIFNMKTGAFVRTYTEEATDERGTWKEKIAEFLKKNPDCFVKP